MKQQGIMSEQDVVYALKFGKELPSFKDSIPIINCLSCDASTDWLF